MYIICKMDTTKTVKILMLVAFCVNANYVDFKDKPSKHRLVGHIALKGHPYLRNCEPVKEEARKLPFSIKHDVVLSPHWSNREEYDTHPYILKYYSWSYAATKTDVDPETEEIRDSSQNFDIMAYDLNRTGRIHIPAYTAKPGFYTIMLKVSHKMPEPKWNLPKHRTCYFYVRSLDPIPIIDGGNFRIIPSYMNLTISGRNSLDPDKPLDNNNSKTLKFVWSCTQKLHPPFLCNTSLLSSAPEFSISPEKLIPEDKINITLRVENEYGAVQSTSQELNVKPNAAALRIRCVENCPPTLNSTFLAFCDANCQDIREEEYEWSIGVFGGRGRKFVADEKMLQSSKFFVIKLFLRESRRFGLNILRIYYPPKPEVLKCQVFPPLGRSLATWFRFQCVEKFPGDRNNFYELYMDSPVDIVTSGFYPDVFETKFTLPPSQGHTFGVRVSKIGVGTIRGPSTFLEVHPYVLPAEEFYSSALSSAGEPISFEKFRTLVLEIVGSGVPMKETHEYAKQLTNEVVERALNSNVTEVLDLVILSDSIAKLLKWDTKTWPDPTLAKMSIDVCEKMIEKYFENIQKDEFDGAVNDMIQKTWIYCMDVTSPGGSYRLLTPSPAEPDILRKSADHEMIIEEYPDYSDKFDNDSQRVDQMHAAVKRYMDDAIATAKTIAKSMHSGSRYNGKIRDVIVTLIAKDEGKKLYADILECHNIVLIPSLDFNESDESFDVLLTIYHNDLMWWNNKETLIATSIVNVEFWHSSYKKQIKHFNSSVNILFGVKNESHFKAKLVKGNVTVPDNFLELNDTEVDKCIRVFRVGSPKDSVLYVDFHNLPESVDFDVVVTAFDFPTTKTFSESKKTIYTIDDTLELTNYNSYDKWIYIGILPNKKSFAENNPPKILFFDISFVLSFCVRWFDEKREWEQDCRPGKTNSRTIISCHCRHFSIIAGYLQNTEGLVQELNIEDIEMELQVYLIIFITVVVTYTIYGLLMLLSLFRLKSGIYFLSDNIRHHRYGYLVLVRTDEITRSAGTTSNVMIRLIGSKRTSEPHVLNYPDPKLRLLQKSTANTFILTTARHLGEIRNIEIWFDSTGASPEWFCRDIVIYDMQKRVQWFFRIRTWLNLAKNDIHYIQISPSEKEPPGFCNHFRICNHFHTWELLAREGNFSFLARLTTVFSTILMTYVFVIVIHGLPSMELMDCIDPHEKYDLDGYDVFWGALSAFASFVIHLAIAWIYRFSDITFTVRGKKYSSTHRCSWSMWVLLSLMIVFSTSFLLYTGFWIPTKSSLIWLTSCLFGLLIDIIFFENIFIVIQTFFCKFKLEIDIDRKFNIILQNIEGQRRYLYKKFDDELLRPFLSHLYRPLQRIQLLKRKIIATLRYVIYNDLEDLVIYSVYNILLTVLILVYKDPLTVITKEELENMVEGAHTRTFPFGKIRSIGQVYKYLNETLIPVMHPSEWYSNYSLLDSGLMVDNSHKYIGVARLLQHRIIANKCVIPDVMGFLGTKTCWPEYSYSHADTRDFGSKWSPETTSVIYDRFKEIWKFEDYYETWSVKGIIADYGGGGYVAFLGRSLHNSLISLKKYAEMVWIDQHTRSIFIEFLTYNANHNSFVAVRLLYEQSATGYSRSSTEINVIRMVYAGNEYEQATMFISLLYISWWAMLMLKLIIGVYKNFFSIYKRFWLMVDLFINLTTLVCIILFFKRIAKVRDYLDQLESVAHNEFVNYFHLLYVEELLMYFNALLILVATVRLWRFLRFGVFFRIMERTLTIAAYPLLAVTFAFTIILTAFGLSGIVIFNNEFEELAFFMNIVEALIQMSLKPDQFDLTQYVTYQMAYYYFSLYLMVMQVILLLYVIVIIMSYMKAQLECSVGPDRYTVHDYVSEQIEYIPKLLKTKISRLRGGEIENPVTPKAGEFRYANSVLVRKSTMKSMGFIVSCVIRNMNQQEEEQRVLTDYETHLMLNVTKIFVLGSYEGDDFEFFFKGHFEGQKIQLIDEKCIDKIAAATRMLLEVKEPVEEVPKVDPTFVTMSKMIRKQNITLQKCKLLLKLAALKLDEAGSFLLDESTE